MPLTRFFRPTTPPPTGVAPPAPVASRHGGTLPLDRLRIEALGPLDAPVVVVLGGISATAHVAGHPAQPVPGWWDAVVGPGRGIDTARCRVVSIDWLTLPAHPIDTHDQALALATALDQLGVEQVAAVVGASYGGMVGLAFAACWPERLARLVVLCAAHEPHPMATALRSLQRRVVRLGVRSGHAHEAVALARGLGITTYRTAEEFAERFESTGVQTDTGVRFPVEAYLEHAGTRFAIACAAERYLALSESLDLHRVDPTRITTPTTVVAVDSDQLVPPWQGRALVASLAGPSRLVEWRSRFGHDAFLKEADAVTALLRDVIATEVSHAA